VAEEQMDAHTYMDVTVNTPFLKWSVVFIDPKPVHNAHVMKTELK
jgi:hypothetical protein